MSSFFRVISPGKSSAYSQVLISAKAGSVWNKIYENHMNNESFIWTSKAVPLMLNSEEEITVFSSAEALEYNSPGIIIEIYGNTSCVSYLRRPGHATMHREAMKVMQNGPSLLVRLENVTIL